MFRPNSGDQDQEEERTLVQKALLRRFRGDTQLLYRDLPEFMKHPLLRELLQRHQALQDEIHTTFVEAGFGTEPEIAIEASQPVVAEAVTEPEIALEVADPDLNTIPEMELSEAETEADGAIHPENVEVVEEVPEELQADPVAEENEAPLAESDGEGLDAETTPGDLDNDSSAEEPAAMEEKAPVEPPAIPVKLNLPNGKTGVEYTLNLDIAPLHRRMETLLEVQAQGFEGTGLIFTHEGELKIQGTPDDHGKFPVQVLLKFGEDGDRPAQDYRLMGEIDILPDPRKMWKELEPDSTLPYQKPHLRSASLHMAGRTMIAASRRGRSHAHNGTFRDDEFELRVNESQAWYVMAVADGAGSAPYSRRGSQIACDKVMEILETKLDERLSEDIGVFAAAWVRDPNDQLRGQIRNRIYDALSNAAYAGYKAICEEADAMGELPKAFHTTLMVTIVRQYDFGYFVGTWWVGDGAVGVYQHGKHLKLMGVPDGGQFAGQTRFLTMPEIWTDGATVAKRIEFDVVPDFTAVVLMSDGVSDPKFSTDHNMLQLEKWDQLWDDMSDVVDFHHDNLKADEQLLEWLDYWAAGEHDDRTIAILF